MAKGTCENCLTEFWYRNSYSSFGKYCSNKCQKEYENEKRYLAWLAGDNKAWSNSKSFKNAVIRLKGYACCECSISEWKNKPLVLDLEHMDGNSENNLPDNLCLICPNCHSQTETFKNKNKGKGRHYRRMRYKEGKSY